MKKVLQLLVICLLTFVQANGQNNCLPISDCPSAPLLCGYELENNIFNNNVPPGGGFPATCGIDPHNSVWIRILPCNSNLELVIIPLTSQIGDGLQAAIFSGCFPGQEIACNPGIDGGAGFPLTLSATVTPATEYWLMIDGYSGDVCDFQIDVISGIDTYQPLPSSGGPFDGIITGPPSNPCSGIGVATYTATWPGCSTWTGGAFSCAKDSCVCVHWTLPFGAFIIGDECAATVTIDFSGVSPGTYLLKAEPECACEDGLCEECGPICCPVNPATLLITVGSAQIIQLPEIRICNEDDFPDCVYEPGGLVGPTFAMCQVAADPVNCTITQQPYRKNPVIFHNAGELLFCDTILVCGVPYSQPGTYFEICTTAAGCDSTVIFTLKKDPDCLFNCLSLNSPAPPGDSCHQSPFFCGTFLENYCGDNQGLTDDILGGALYENAGFFRFQPCQDSVVFRIGVSNCDPGSVGLSFGVFEGNCPGNNPVSTQNIYQDEFTNLTFTSLDPSLIYSMLVSGVHDSECAFTVEVLEGIGTATAGPVTCDCIDGYIEGPDRLCPGDIGTFTLVPPLCTISGGLPAGGNGYMCDPVGSIDSLVWVWHIPEETHFVGDSTGLTIQIMVDSSFFDLDTLIMTTVWVSSHLVPISSGNVPEDTLSFCGTAGLLDCTPVVPPKQLEIYHNIDHESCILNCFNQFCFLQGMTFTQPGTFVIDIDNCNRLIAHILQDFIIPGSPFIPNKSICQGESVQLQVSNNPSFFGTNWSTGATGSTITVSPTVTTTYSVTVTNWSNGCTAQGQTTVTVIPVQLINMGEIGVITCNQPCITFQGQQYCQPGQYQIETGICTFQLFSIGFDPTPMTVTMPPETICAGDCIDFFGQQICSNGLYTHEENCTIFVQEVSVIPIQVTDLGIVGTITCSNSCVDFQGTSYCQPGQYQVPTGICTAQTFIIELDTTLPVQILPPVTICAGECFDFFGQTICISDTATHEENCTVLVQEVIVTPIQVTDLGVVGAITCSNPCVDFQGTSYCQPGQYQVPTGPCTAQTFTIEQDTTLPVQILPPVTICAGECFDFFGQMICIGDTVSQEDNCTLLVQEVIVLPVQVTSLGVVGIINCTQSCVDFQGVSYCQPGTFTIPAGQCDVATFEIVFEKETLELGEIGIITCIDTCVIFEGQSYCQAGNYTVEDSCFIKHFSVGANLSAPTCSAPAHQCLPNNTHFTVGFSITGQAPFKVNGEVLNGSNYLSAPLPNGATYNFIVKQLNGCSDLVNGTFDCASMCITDAGELSTETLHGCAGQSVLQALPMSSPVLATGDVAEYWLQTAAGIILDQNNTGAFAFNPATMSMDVPYFVRRVAGPSSFSGHPDLLNACTDSSGLQPVIFHAPPAVQIMGASTICGGDPLPLTATGAATYLWENGVSSTSVTFETTDQLQTKTYTVVGTDALGCTATASTEVLVLEKPVLDEVTLRPPLCTGDDDGMIEIKLAHGSMEPLRFAFNGGALGTSQTFQQLAPGTYSIYVEDAFGCHTEHEYELAAPIPPQLQIGPDRHINLGEQVTLAAEASSVPASIQWTSDNGLSQTGGLEWQLQPMDNMLVYCEMVDSNGCKASDEAVILVEILSDIYRPNVLLLDAVQGENQHFTIYAAEGWVQKIVSLSIFDRWGEMVWQKQDFPANAPNLGWDGSVKGSPVQPGVFVYLVVVELANGNQLTLKGDVTVLR